MLRSSMPKWGWCSFMPRRKPYPISAVVVLMSWLNCWCWSFSSVFIKTFFGWSVTSKWCRWRHYLPELIRMLELCPWSSQLWKLWVPKFFPILTWFLSEHHTDDVLASCGKLVPFLLLFQSAFFDSRFVLCLVLSVISQAWAEISLSIALT